LNIPNLTVLTVAKDFVSNKLCQVWFTKDMKVQSKFNCDGDLTWPIYKDIESILHQKYGNYNIYYCSKDQAEAHSVWIQGDLSLNLYRHYREIEMIPRGTLCDGLVMIRYYKNSLIEEKAKIEKENQRKYEIEKNQKDRIRRDTLSKYF
jgi:hypothetical protein